MLRYVVLAHDYPEPHFDFMLEDNGVLLTWRLPQWPLVALTPLLATGLPPHRIVYLTYEGPVSGNRGRVQRVDAGTFSWIDRSEMNWCIVLNSNCWERPLQIQFDGQNFLASPTECGN